MKLMVNSNPNEIKYIHAQIKDELKSLSKMLEDNKPFET